MRRGIKQLIQSECIAVLVDQNETLVIGDLAFPIRRQEIWEGRRRSMIRSDYFCYVSDRPRRVFATPAI